MLTQEVNAMFKLELHTGNAAFTNGPDLEVARILREVADKVSQGDTSGKLRDYNGNTVGSFELTTEDTE